MKRALEILRKLQIQTDGKQSFTNLMDTITYFIEHNLDEAIHDLEEHQNKSEQEVS